MLQDNVIIHYIFISKFCFEMYHSPSIIDIDILIIDRLYELFLFESITLWLSYWWLAYQYDRNSLAFIMKDTYLPY